MRGVMPEQLRTRKDKIGFSPPMFDWFNGGLGDWVLEQVSSASFLESEIWDGPAIRDFVATRHPRRMWQANECQQVWPFLQAHLWRQVFLERSPTAPVGVM
jgi:asparagine synthase (glutamine-hydrolysing)